MRDRVSPLTALRERLGAVGVVEVARDFGARASGNTYLHFDSDELVQQAAGLRAGGALYGVPVSLKDCFGLKGTVTTFGSRFYAGVNPVAQVDSTVAARLREAGCLITGKTHMQELAYGLTGENAFYGDCVQPRDRALLTGGSSSGAAASVQEGSAIAAVGTDTGGSIRMPAALCGLVGFRLSHGRSEGLWVGGHHLAPSFDTLGLLFEDVRDAAELVGGMFGIGVNPQFDVTVGCVSESWMGDCELAVLAAYRAWKEFLVLAGVRVVEFVPRWEDGVEIFVGIQAHEAAGIHRGHFGEFEPAIAQRLEWGGSLSVLEAEGLRERRGRFCAGMDVLFEEFDFLMMPCAPVSRLRVGEDHAAVRPGILRYTTPASVAGLPVLALPGEEFGTGVQVIGRAGGDGELLGFLEAVGLG